MNFEHMTLSFLDYVLSSVCALYHLSSLTRVVEYDLSDVGVPFGDTQEVKCVWCTISHDSITNIGADTGCVLTFAKPFVMSA